MAGLRRDGVIAPFVLDGPMTGEVFRAYVEQMLTPSLRPGDVVVLDRLPAHKVAGVREAIQAAGASLLYLPAYSPDLNPIEQLFAKLKALLRKATARTRDALWDTIGALLDAFTSAKCQNYIANSGYEFVQLQNACLMRSWALRRRWAAAGESRSHRQREGSGRENAGRGGPS